MYITSANTAHRGTLVRFKDGEMTEQVDLDFSDPDDEDDLPRARCTAAEGEYLADAYDDFSIDAREGETDDGGDAADSDTDDDTEETDT